MVISKISKIAIVIAVVLFIIVVLGIILGVTLWNITVPIGGNNQVSSHYFTIQEARIAKYFLPFNLLLPEKTDGDVAFAYGDTITGHGIDKDRLKEIKKILATNTIDYTRMSEADFRNLRYCEVTVKCDDYDIKLISFYEKISNVFDLYMFSDVINEKGEDRLSINRTYFSGLNRGYSISIYPKNYEWKKGDKYWENLTKEEKIKLYGREWFDSVELSDIDEFMREVCAYNGINSDWLDNKPIYNIK